MDSAHVEVDLGFFPLMWILFLVSPWLSIDGVADRRRWGKHQVTLQPGTHVIAAWFPYIFRSQTCLASTTLDAMPGRSYKLRYRPAWLMFLPGKMTVTEQPALPEATARQLP